MVTRPSWMCAITTSNVCPDAVSMEPAIIFSNATPSVALTQTASVKLFKARVWIAQSLVTRLLKALARGAVVLACALKRLCAKATNCWEIFVIRIRNASQNFATPRSTNV